MAKSNKNKKKGIKAPVNPPLHELNKAAGKIVPAKDKRDAKIAELEAQVADLTEQLEEATK